MRTTKFSAALGTALLTCLLIVLSGCGQTYSLQTITLSLGPNETATVLSLKGLGGTLQLAATGTYTNGKTQDLTSKVTYTMTAEGSGLGAVTLNSTGMMTAVQPSGCSWTNVGTTSSPVYVLKGDYKVVASFDGVDSQPIFVGVASATGDGPLAACGP